MTHKWIGYTVVGAALVGGTLCLWAGYWLPGLYIFAGALWAYMLTAAANLHHMEHMPPVVFAAIVFGGVLLWPAYTVLLIALWDAGDTIP